jgi:hypothetical protein
MKTNQQIHEEDIEMGGLNIRVICGEREFFNWATHKWEPLVRPYDEIIALQWIKANPEKWAELQKALQKALHQAL